MGKLPGLQLICGVEPARVARGRPEELNLGEAIGRSKPYPAVVGVLISAAAWILSKIKDFLCAE
jgi:hypothetical protein